MALDCIKVHYASLDKARELLKREENFSLCEAKGAYRRLALRWHLDQAGRGRSADAEERMKEFNATYEFLVDCCERYPIPLGIDSLRETDPFYDHFRRFYHDYFADAYTGR